MGDELSLLLEIFNKIEKAGGQATLCVATGGGKTKVKLEITTTPAPPTGSTPTSSGRRQCRRGPRARARRNQRAAAHQAALAEAAATSAPLRSPTPRLLPVPPPESGRRLVTAVARPVMPTFSTLCGWPFITSTNTTTNLTTCSTFTTCTISIVATTTYTASIFNHTSTTSINGCLHSADERR